MQRILAGFAFLAVAVSSSFTPLSAQTPAPPPAQTRTPIPAQRPAPPKVTHVLATLTVKPGVTRDQIMPVMPSEVHDTVQLYLDGKIQQWWARGDGKGVVFLLDCKTVEEAKAIVEALPLIKHELASFDYMPLGPLSPLRVLLAPPVQ